MRSLWLLEILTHTSYNFDRDVFEVPLTISWGGGETPKILEIVGLFSAHTKPKLSHGRGGGKFFEWMNFLLSSLKIRWKMPICYFFQFLEGVAGSLEYFTFGLLLVFSSWFKNILSKKIQKISFECQKLKKFYDLSKFEKLWDDLRKGIYTKSEKMTCKILQGR